jgi:hypothetical protein
MTAHQTETPTGPTAGFITGNVALTKAMMYHPDSDMMIPFILESPLDNEHSNHGLAWKLILDRQIPTDYLHKAKGGNQVNVIIEGDHREAE